LECTRYNSYQLPPIEANDQWRLLLCSLIGPFQFKQKTFLFGEEESALPSKQCTGLHVPGTDGQIQRIPLRIASSIFARFSSLRLFPVSKSEEIVRKKEIHHQRAAHRRTKAYFEGLTNHIIRLEKIEESLDQVYQTEFYYVFLKIY